MSLEWRARPKSLARSLAWSNPVAWWWGSLSLVSAPDPAHNAWLEAEARHLAHRNPPAMPTTYHYWASFSESRRGPGYLRRWIAGETIGARLRRMGTEDVPAVLRVMREIGSALSYLHQFRIDGIKIDRRFIENLEEAGAARVVRALAGLGHGLGAEHVVALALMGSFAVVARLPFAAAASLAGAGDTGIYRAGVLACALALMPILPNALASHASKLALRPRWWDRNCRPQTRPDPASSSAPWKIYNIGNNRPEELMQVVALLEKEFDGTAIKEMLPMQPGDVPATYADIEDLARDVGFRPSTSIEDGIARFAEWFRAYGRM